MTSPVREMRSHTLWQLASAAYQEVVGLMQLYFAGMENRYRLGLVGDTALPIGHPLLTQGFEFGKRLASAGIDLVIACSRTDTFPGQAALGYNDAIRRGCKGGYLIVVQASFPDQRPAWLGSGDHVRYYPQDGLTSVFEFMSGCVTDVLAVVPGLDAYATLTELWQRAQLCLKIALRPAGIEGVPLGLRLRNASVVFGWRPQSICVGDSKRWGWMEQARNTYVTQKTLSEERGEHLFINFQADLDDAMRHVVDRATQWDELVNGHKEAGRLPNVHLKSIAKRFRSAYKRYLDYLGQLEPKAHGFYRVAVFGSHSLQPDDPALNLAYELGKFLGFNNIYALEGNAGLASIMGQVALGHSDGRTAGNTTARSYGVSIQLPWESAETTASMRHVVYSLQSLSPRLDAFFLYSLLYILLKGGVGTQLEDAAWLIRAVTAIRHDRRDIPIGMRLLSRSARLKWPTKSIAVGGDEICGWRKSARETFLTWGVLDPTRGEDQLMQFAPDLGALEPMITDDRAAWRSFIRRKGFDICN